jgi:hypothetical protein
MRVELNTLGTNYKSLYEHYTNSMTVISEAIRKLNGRGKQGATFAGQMSEGGDVGLLRAEHKQLRTEVEVLQQINRSTQVAGLSNTTAPWRAEVDLLKRKLGDLEGNSGQMFVHKLLIFWTKQDVKHWVVSVQVESPGIFWDLFSAMWFA